MVNINIGKGQGMTQAIASNLGLQKEDCKNVSLSTWQQVMTLVDQNNTQQTQGKKSSVFSGSHDASVIGDKSTHKTNFMVHTGQNIEIDEGIWGRIKNLLTGKSSQPSQVAQPATTNATSSVSQNSNVKEATVASTQTVDGVVTTVVNKTTEVAPVVATKPLGYVELVNQKHPVMVQNTPPEGDLKTGEAVYKMIEEMNKLEDMNAEITVTSDEWRALANKKNKTPEEITRMKNEHSEGMKKVGNSLTMYIDKKFGDGSGKINQAAFMKYQADGAPAEVLNDPQFKLEQQNAFKRLDLNKDGAIDNEEMSAFMFALDYDENNKSNGIIKLNDYIANAESLGVSEPNILDKKLASTYGALYGKKPVE